MLIIREYKKEDLGSVAKVHVDTWNSAYADILPQDYLKSRTYESQLKKWVDRLLKSNTAEFMLVAQNDDGNIIGFSTGSLNKKGCIFDSTLYTLYILKEYQNMGLGKSLVKAVASRLYKSGAKSMVLSALAENSACNFYEHIGGKQVDKKTVNIAKNDVAEVSYAWDDISCLVNL